MIKQLPTILSTERKRNVSITTEQPATVYLWVLTLFGRLAPVLSKNIHIENSMTVKGFTQKCLVGISSFLQIFTSPSHHYCPKVSVWSTWHILHSFAQSVLWLDTNLTVQTSFLPLWVGKKEPTIYALYCWHGPEAASTFPRHSTLVCYLRSRQSALTWQLFTATFQLNCTVSSTGAEPVFPLLFTNITRMDSNWIYMLKSIG